MNQEQNRLIIISDRFFEKVKSKKQWYVFCNCSCGIKNHKVLYNNLIKNKTKSCGCLRRELISQRRKNKFKHNLCEHPLYHVWRDMKGRCLNKKHKEYKNYGGRGIKIYNEWINDIQLFYNVAIKIWKPGLILDRKNNDGNYTPDNIRFVTDKISSNNKRTNHIIVAFGEKKNLKQWSEDSRCKVSYKTLLSRINDYHWDINKALTFLPHQRENNV